MDQLRPATISRGPWCWDQESLHLCCRGYHFVSGPIEQTPGCLGADTHKTSSLVHLIYKSFLCSGRQQTGTHAGYKYLSTILGGSGLSLPLYLFVSNLAPYPKQPIQPMGHCSWVSVDLTLRNRTTRCKAWGSPQWNTFLLCFQRCPTVGLM